MHNLSDILSAASKSKVTMNENSLASFAATSFNDDKRLSTVGNAIKTIEKNISTSSEFVKTQNVLSLDTDEKLVDFIQILDCLSAFSVVSEVFFKDDKKENDWYALQIKKKLLSINTFVNQLASCITIHHEELQTDLNMNVDIFDSSKTLATIIKQLDDYKLFKKNARKRIDFSNQSLNIRSLATIILLKTKELITIL